MPDRSHNSKLPLGLVLSAGLHLLLLAGLVFFSRSLFSTRIVAAGEGESGAGQAQAIEVGVVDARQLGANFGLTPPKPVSNLGDTNEAVNNELVATKRSDPAPAAEPLPTEKRKPIEKAKTTERPTANQTERLVTKQPMQARSPDKTVEVGRTYGSATPEINGGIGVKSGGGAGNGGVPGGSAYGQIIQRILSRNYNPPNVAEASGTSYVVIQLRIASDGQILSVAGGRVGTNYLKRSSPYELVNRAAERAVIASNPLPAFPAGFLPGVSEAVAEIWFRYPK